MEGRPLDNLEFLQWMKCYYDTSTGGIHPTDYDGAERRSQSKGGNAFVKKAAVAGPSRAAAAGSTRAAAAAADKAPAASSSRPTSSRTAGAASAAVGGKSRAMASGAPGGSAQVRELTAQNTEMRLAVERTEQEREFYFEKLQDIEFLCQRPEFANQTLTKVVERILYFTEGKPDIEAIIAECSAAAAPHAEADEQLTAPAPVVVEEEEAMPAPAPVETEAGDGPVHSFVCSFAFYSLDSNIREAP